MKSTFFKYLLFFIVVFFGVFSCVKKTTYPTTPVIEFKAFYPFVGDSADLQLKFTDGDGDIAVSSDNTIKNFWYTYYYKDTITNLYRAYAIYNDSTGIYDTLRTGYPITLPDDSYKGKPISGEISVRLQRFRHSKKIKNVKYVFYLFDQAGNKSNVVTSPEFNVQ